MCGEAGSKGGRKQAGRRASAAVAQQAPPQRFNQPLGFVSSGLVDPYQLDRPVIQPARCPAAPVLAMPPVLFDSAAMSLSRGGSPEAELASAPDQAAFWEELGRDMLAEPMALGMAEGERPAGLGFVAQSSMQEAGPSPMLGAEAVMPAEPRRSGIGCSAQHAEAAPGQAWDEFRAPQVEAAQPMEPGEPCMPRVAPVEGDARFSFQYASLSLLQSSCWLG